MAALFLIPLEQRQPNDSRQFTGLCRLYHITQGLCVLRPVQ
jgi:hypothetical protein